MRAWSFVAKGLVVGLLVSAGCSSSSDGGSTGGPTVECGEGTTLVGSSCVALSDGGGAVCGPGTTLQGSQCVAVSADAGGADSAVTCAPGTYLDGGTCVASPTDGGAGVTCGPGTYADGGQCVPMPTGTTAKVTLTPSNQPQSVAVPGTTVLVHVPPGSVSAPVDLTISTAVLAPTDVVPASDPISPGASLVEAGLRIASTTSTLDGPVWIEQPVAFPPLFASLPSGAVTVIPMPTYSRTDASQPWSRDDLSPGSSSAPDGAGFLVLDTTTMPPVAAAVMAVDHFSDHSVAIPSFNSDPSLGWGAMFATYTTGGATLLVPATLFTNSALQYGTLSSATARQAIYGLLIEEVVEQTAAKRDAVLGSIDAAVDGLQAALIAGQADLMTGGRFSEFSKSLADWQISLVDLTSAEKDIVTNFVQDLSGLDQKIPGLDDIDKFRNFTKCFTGGLLQLGLYATLDQVQVQHRWAAVKPKLILSPLFTSDPAYAAAVLAADTRIKAYVGTRFGQRLASSATQWAEGMLAGCSDVVIDAFAGYVADSVYKAAIASLGGTSSLAAIGAGAVAAFLVKDYVTKDIVEATAAAQRMSLLGTMLVEGGVAVDIPHEPALQSTHVLDADNVSVPPKLDAWASSSDVWYRLQTGIYAASALTKTTADTLRLQDVSLLGKGFQAWKDVFALGVWGKASRTQAADSFDTKTTAYDAALVAIGDAFAACSAVGCSATCQDSDHDGYGQGAACLGPDCDDGDSLVHTGCSADAGADGSSVDSSVDADGGSGEASTDGAPDADASADSAPDADASSGADADAAVGSDAADAGVPCGVWPLVGTPSEVTITGIGLIKAWSRPVGVSADGASVVGTGGYVYNIASGGYDGVAVRWTAPLGLQPLDSNPMFATNANAISWDGTTVVGMVGNTTGYRWYPGGETALENLSNGDKPRQPLACNSDCSVIVGQTTNGAGFYWKAGISSPITVGANAVGGASGVSSDGTTVTGTTNTGTPGGQPRAFLWDTINGGILLDSPFALMTSSVQASAISADGRVVVGTCNDMTHPQAYRWSTSSGPQALGALPSGSYSQFAIATAATSDGCGVVGYSNAASGQVGFIWDQSSGMRDINAWLTGLGVDLHGWVIQSIDGMSPDGKFLVGTGTSGEGFVLKL